MKINTDKKIYYAVCTTLAVFLAIVMIYREIPSGKTDGTEITKEKLIPEPVTLLTESADGYAGTFSEQSPPQTAALTDQSAELSAVLSTNFSENSSADTVNINTADLKTLMSLKGIGEKKAQSIIEYRTANGGFTSVDEIASVPGIGKKTAGNIREFISV